MNTSGPRQSQPALSHRTTSRPSFLAARNISQHRFAETFLEGGSDTQGLAGQTNPCLRLNGRLSLFVNVPPRPQATRLGLDSRHGGPPRNTKVRCLSPVRMQTE